MEFNIEDLGSQTLTKSGLGDLLCKQIGLSKREAIEMVDSFFGMEPAEPARATFVSKHCGAAMLIVETLARGQSIRAPPVEMGGS